MVQSAKNPIVEHAQGTIARANDRGVVLEGSSEWLNVSRFADNPPAIPAVGTAVKLGLDKDGFIRAITILDPAYAQQPARQAKPQTRQEEPPPAEEPPPWLEPEPPAARRPPLQERELRITRLACINSAIAMLTVGAPGELNPDSVMVWAEALENWVNRP